MRHLVLLLYSIARTGCLIFIFIEKWHCFYSRSFILYVSPTMNKQTAHFLLIKTQAIFCEYDIAFRWFCYCPCLRWFLVPWVVHLVNFNLQHKWHLKALLSFCVHAFMWVYVSCFAIQQEGYSCIHFMYNVRSKLYCPWPFLLCACQCSKLALFGIIWHHFFRWEQQGGEKVIYIVCVCT